METLIRGKKILFFAAQFLGYQYEIKKAMEARGAIVDYFDERPANNFFVKAAIRINRDIISSYIDSYHKAIINKTKDIHYDYIFIIKGESISFENIKLLKLLHPNAKVVMYHWDSFANNKNALSLMPYVDVNFSFDFNDCRLYNLTFLPLFYINEYANVSTDKNMQEYDTLFIGTAHSDRCYIVKRLEEIVNGNSYSWFYLPSRVLYFRMLLQKNNRKALKNLKINYKALDKKTIIRLYESSKIIIDIQHPKQAGLTMRCIETLGARKKLITTNAQIKEYDFYNPNNILVIDRENPYVSEDFIKGEYVDIPEDIYNKYSIDGWLNQIFNSKMN